MKAIFSILLLAIALTSCGQKEKLPVKKLDVTDGLHYNYILLPKQDSLRYYNPGKDTFHVAVIFSKISHGYPMPDIVTEVDNALDEYVTLQYNPQQYSGDNIINPLGWNFSKGQVFNVAHHKNTLSFLQVDGWLDYEFNGYKIEYHAEKFESYGIVGVSIDRGPETMVDLYAPVNYNNSQAVFIADSLKNDTIHIIRIRYTHQRNPNSNSQNARITFDKFVTYQKQPNYFAPKSPAPAKMQYDPGEAKKQ